MNLLKKLIHEATRIELSARQKEILLFGQSRQAGKGFLSSLEPYKAWTSNREELMNFADGLYYPWAFHTFELSDSPARWYDVLALLRGGFIDLDCADVERMSPMCRELAPASELAIFQSVETVRATGYPPDLLVNINDTLSYAWVWNWFRQRPEIGHKYLRCSQSVRQYLRTVLRVLSSEKGR